jgi:hypothetical protein
MLQTGLIGFFIRYTVTLPMYMAFFIRYKLSFCNTWENGVFMGNVTV